METSSFVVRSGCWTVLMAILIVLAACGVDPDSEGGNGATGDTANYCAAPDAPDEGSTGTQVVSSNPVQALDHDGGRSDLDLDWTEDELHFKMCPGENVVDLAIHNASNHTPGRTVWYTILYFAGQEYVSGHGISPQGMDIAVGETIPVRFTLNLLPAFASSERSVRITLIVQTDNPNPRDPNAFFRRVQTRITPRDDCQEPAMAQPAPQPLNIHSVACKNHLAILQTSPDLLDGSPTSSIVSGHAYLSQERNTYFEDDLWWADYLVTQNIPPDEQAVISFGSHPGDTMFFRIGPRVQCGGRESIRWDPDSTPGRSESDLPAEEDTSADNGVEFRQPDDSPDENVTGTDPVEGRLFALTPCAWVLPGITVPLEMGGSRGQVYLTESGGKTELVVESSGLPVNPKVNGEAAVYRPWLATEVEDGRWIFVSLDSFNSISAEVDTQHAVAVDVDGLRNAAGHYGVEMLLDNDGLRIGGILTERDEALPLEDFTHFLVTLEPLSNTESAQERPGARAVLSGVKGGE